MAKRRSTRILAIETCRPGSSILHNRGIIRRVYRPFVRVPNVSESLAIPFRFDNASLLIANDPVKELGLRVVNHLANYSPFLLLLPLSLVNSEQRAR